jgi:ribose transport system substrate-binding protein
MSRAALILAFVVLLAAVVGCGSSGSSSTSSGSTEAEVTESNEGETTEASSGEEGGEGASGGVQEQLATDYEGVFGELPKSGPKAEPGKSIWIISLSQAAAGAKLPSEAAAEAAEKVGWTAKIFDGKGDYGRMSEGIDAAVSSGADGIIVVAADCGQLKSALERAKDAGVPTYGLISLDCNAKYGGSGASEYSATSQYGANGNYGTLLEEVILPMQVAWSVAKAEESGGSIVAFTETDNAIMKYSKNGVVSALEEMCTGDCESHEYSMTFQDVLQGRLATKISAALAQNPTASVVMLPYDAAVTAGGLEAVASSGRAAEISLIGAGGAPENYDLIRSGKQGATVAVSPRWEGWAAVDGLNRVFAGAEQVDPGIGGQIVDKEHNLPPEGQEYEAPVEFAANYERIWGVK